MGKGDKKSRKGKITMGSHGVLRPRKKAKAKTAVAKKIVAPVKETSVSEKAVAPVKKMVAAEKSESPKKAAAPKKAAPPKKTAAKKAE